MQQFAKLYNRKVELVRFQYTPPILRYRMVLDLKRLTDLLRSNTPEEFLKRRIENQREELVAALREGRSFEIPDNTGRVLRITPPKAA